jgi:hypothetical protein
MICRILAVFCAFASAIFLLEAFVIKTEVFTPWSLILDPARVSCVFWLLLYVAFALLAFLFWTHPDTRKG